jgi:hypothetical protein
VKQRCQRCGLVCLPFIAAAPYLTHDPANANSSSNVQNQPAVTVSTAQKSLVCMQGPNRRASLVVTT